MVKVPRIGGPSPAAHRNPCLDRHILELAIPEISIQRIAGHVTLVKRSDLFWLLGLERRLTKNAYARRDPHASSINILVAVIVEVQPACAHPSANVIDVGRGGNGRKGPVVIVPVEIV